MQKAYKCYYVLFDSEENTIDHTEAIMERIKREYPTIAKIEFHNAVLRDES